MGQPERKAGSAAPGFLAWLLTGTAITAVAALITVAALPDSGATGTTTGSRPGGSDRYARLAPACGYLDRQTAREALPEGREEGGESPVVGSDRAVICVWHRPKDRSGPRREVSVEVAIYRTDTDGTDGSGAEQAAEAFADIRVRAEEDVPPQRLPRPVTGFGEEAIATPGPFHAGGLQYRIRQGNVILRVLVAAGKGDPATAKAREAKDAYVRALSRYALAKLG